MTTVFDISSIIHNIPLLLESLYTLTEDDINLCKSISDHLVETSCLLIKDPRVVKKDNDVFLDLMEDYFSQGDDIKELDSRPEIHYQVGSTPSLIETPRILQDENLRAKLEALPEEHKAIMPVHADVKWRYFWRLGPRPKCSAFYDLNPPPVIPQHFPQFATTMDTWGKKLHDTAEAVAVLIAIGFGLPPSSILDLMHEGPHLLAPTGSDLSRFGSKNSVLAGYHYDLNLLTLHGKSRFPGLHLWLSNGRRVVAKVPEGAILVQAGKQMEWLTGGTVKAGMHEVIVTDDLLATIRSAEDYNRGLEGAGRNGEAKGEDLDKEGWGGEGEKEEQKEKEKGKQKGRKKSLWRVSSTAFFHIASDKTLVPFKGFPFCNPDDRSPYPPIQAGRMVQNELEAISLKAI